MSPYFLTDGVRYYAGHYCAYEAYAHYYYYFSTFGTVEYDKLLETLDFGGFILRRGEGELFTAGGDRVLSAEC